MPPVVKKSSLANKFAKRRELFLCSVASIELSERDMQSIASSIENPSEPNERLRKAFKRAEYLFVR